MTEEGATAGKAGAQFDLYNDRAMRCLLFKKTKLAILKCVDLNQVRMTPVLVSNKNDKRFHSQASHSHGRHWLGAPLFRLGVFNARWVGGRRETLLHPRNCWRRAPTYFQPPHN